MHLFKKQRWSIDMGTSRTRICRDGKIVLDEPTLVFMVNEEFVVAGTHALHSDNPLRARSYDWHNPLFHGDIADYEMAEWMLRYLIKIIKRRKVCSLYCSHEIGMGEIEKCAMKEVLEGAICHKAKLVPSWMAAATELGLNESKDLECIVDVGGGLTECTILLGGDLVSDFIPFAVGGGDFDEATRLAVEKELGVKIGTRTARYIKEGFAKKETIENVHGRTCDDGLPSQFSVSHSMVKLYYEKSFKSIVDYIGQKINAAPPTAKLKTIHLIGGSALLRGLKEYIEQHFEIPVTIPPNPEYVVVLGLDKMQTSKR